MSNRKTDLSRLGLIVHYCELLLSTIERYDISREDILSNYEVQWLVSTPISNIDEQANNLSKDFVDSHRDTPWSSIAGMRHRIDHHYEGINWSMVADVVEYELEPLLESSKHAIEELLQESEKELDDEEEQVAEIDNSGIDVLDGTCDAILAQNSRQREAPKSKPRHKGLEER